MAPKSNFLPPSDGDFEMFLRKPALREVHWAQWTLVLAPHHIFLVHTGSWTCAGELCGAESGSNAPAWVNVLPLAPFQHFQNDGHACCWCHSQKNCVPVDCVMRPSCRQSKQPRSFGSKHRILMPPRAIWDWNCLCRWISSGLMVAHRPMRFPTRR